MKIDELNRYLSKLEGEGYIEKLDMDKGTLLFKFCGSVGGPYDDGEIELTFHDVEVINLPTGMILPARLEQVNQEQDKNIIGVNYHSYDRNLYNIYDDTGITWHVYAGSFSVNVLPIFWKRS